MTTAIQYEEDGTISAVVSGFPSDRPPPHPRQLLLEKAPDTTNMRVNLETRKLEPCPVLTERARRMKIYHDKKNRELEAEIDAAVAEHDAKTGGK